MSINLDQKHNELALILEQRHALFPIKTEENTRAMYAAMEAYIHALHESVPDIKLTVDQDQLNTIAQLPPVFICGSMKSGTTLLLQLLDGHPELIVMPGDSHLIDFSNRTDWQNASLEKWQDHWVHNFVNPTGQQPFWILGDADEAYFNMSQVFRWAIRSLPEISHRWFLAGVYAYYAANPQRPARPKHWVEKTPGNERHLKQLLGVNSNAKFIHIIRDGRDNLASLKRLSRHRSDQWQGRIQVFTLLQDLKQGRNNQQKLGEAQYMFLPYEHLLADPEGTMTKIAAFLDIEDVPSLRVPTTNMIPATANSMHKDEQVSGAILSKKGNKWKQELNVLEKSALLHDYYPQVGWTPYRWEAPGWRRLFARFVSWVGKHLEKMN